MSKIIRLSIDLTSIPRSKVVDHKNGKKYLAVDVWVNDEPDKYGNDVSANISQTKEERENKEKKIYIGNGQTKFGFEDSIKITTKTGPQTVAADDDDDDLSF